MENSKDNFKKIGLQFRAYLENLTNLKPGGEGFRWYLKLRCTNCHEESETFEYLTLLESAPLKGGRGSASLVVICKLCGREYAIDIIRDTLTSYNAEDSGKFKTMVVFDCRGAEPIDFSPRVQIFKDETQTLTSILHKSKVSLTTLLHFPHKPYEMGETYDFPRKNLSLVFSSPEYKVLKAGFTAEGEGTGTLFDDVSLTHGDWVDYDEKIGEAVGIRELEYKFVKVK